MKIATPWARFQDFTMSAIDRAKRLKFTFKKGVELYNQGILIPSEPANHSSHHYK